MSPSEPRTVKKYRATALTIGVGATNMLGYPELSRVDLRQW
jgi:hypothetical protein